MKPIRNTDFATTAAIRILRGETRPARVAATARAVRPRAF